MPNPVPRSSQPQPVPPLPPEVAKSGALFVQSIAVQQDNPSTSVKPAPDEGLIRVAKIAVAVVAVTALRATVNWFRSRNSAPSAVTSLELVDQAAPLPNDVLLDLKGSEVLAVTCHVTSDDLDLSSLYAQHPAEIKAAVEGAIRSYFGAKIESLVVITPGSLWVRVVARVKSAWNSAGMKIKSTYDTVKLRINLSELSRRIAAAVTNTAKRLGAAVKSPQFRASVRTSYNVLVGIINLAAAIAPVLEFFGISGASELADYIREHLPRPPQS